MKAKRPVGRPTALTPELQEKVVRAIRGGCHFETAAALVGLSRRTLEKWRKRTGKAYVEFTHAIEQARAVSEARDLSVVQAAAAAGDWRAAGWILEHRFPAHWQPTQKVRNEHTGANGGPIVRVRLERPKVFIATEKTGLSDHPKS